MGDVRSKAQMPASRAAPTDRAELSEDVEAFVADPKLLVLVCLLVIALLGVSYVAADIVLPIVLAFILNLLFQPGMRLLDKLRIPRSVAALSLILGVFAAIVALGVAMSGPATAWAQQLPSGMARLEEHLRLLNEPIQALQAFLRQFDGGVRSEAGSGPSISETLFRGTQHFASGFFQTLLILFFLLVSGDTFLRRLVEILPTFGDKRQVVALSQQIEKNVSAYLLTITCMNAVVGIATGLVMWVCGVGDPVLWGGIAFLLNYVQIIGPLVGVVLFFFAGLLAIDNLWQALIPAGLYLLIHLVEGEAVTPLLLSRRFTLNPVLVVISLVFWFWMWGVPGAILAVPMLAILKIVSDRVRPLKALGHILEG